MNSMNKNEHSISVIIRLLEKVNVEQSDLQFVFTQD